MKRVLFLGWILIIAAFSATTFGQTDTEFWFVVPELSHRNNTGGTPGTLRISTLELEATVTISMPANPYDAVSNPNGFQDIVLNIPANSASSVDLTHLIDTDALPDNNRLENKPLTPQGINNFGLHITATNVITTYWEVNYQYGSDLWTLKGSNGLGTLFYAPFQTIYPNNNILPARAYSAIDVVATEDNTRVTFQLPAGKAASYGLNAANTIPAGGTYTTPPLKKGQTFSIYPFRYSVLGADRLSGTRVSSTAPIAVSVKDDGILTPPSGQTTVGDQIVPVSIAGDTYIVPEVQNPNHVYILATEDNTNIEVFIADGTTILSTVLNEGEQIMAMIPNGAKFARITSRLNAGDPFKPIYVWQVVGTGNQNRGGALVPPIGCTGNTQLAFTRAREGENGFYFYVITEKQNMDKFLVDGEKRDDLIPPVMGNRGFTELAGSGGWVAQLTSSINANVLATGQHLVENTGGIFHLGIINGFPSAQRGALFYGYYSDFGGLNVGATIAGTNSSVVRSCIGDPVPLHAFGGTSYQWTPDTYLSDASSSTPTAIDLPVGPHNYTVNVSGACGSGAIDLTIVVTPPVEAHFETNVISGCSPLEISFEDLSSGVYEWQYDLGDGSPLMRYDSITTNNETGNAWPFPPDPFTFTHTYTNTTDSIIEFEITLLTKNISGCDSTYSKTITVFPEVHSAFELDRSEGCGPLEVQFTNNSWGHAETYLWDFGDGNTSTSSDSILSHTFQNNTPFPVTYMVTLRAGNAEGCVHEVQHTVTVYPEVEASFSTNIQEACSPSEFLFHNYSTGASTYSWDFGDGGSSSEQDPIHRYDRNMRTNDTVFRVRLVSVSNELCRDSVFLDVVLHPYIEANFNMDTAVCHLSDVSITNTSIGADSYTWDFGDGSPVSRSSDPELDHYYLNVTNSPVNYTVELRVENEEGCMQQMQKNVVVYPESEGGIMNGSNSRITFGSSTGPVLLTGHTGEVLKWQKIVKAGPWVDIAHTDTQYSEIPASADLWQYRAVVQSGACDERPSDLFSIFVDPKELVITPAPEQTKREGDPDPVFTFTNSEWAENTNFTGTLMRESGETPGEYAYLLGDLSAGSNYMLAMNPDATKFTITSTVGYEEFQDSKDLSLFSYSNPFQESTVLAYALPFDGRVTLTIRNMAGQVLHTLVNSKVETKGDYSIVFGDSKQEAGLYFATLVLEGDNELVTCTLKLIKSR